MSSTEGRRERMQRILKLLEQNPQGLNPHQIANKTQLITEITMDRLHKYLAELTWADLLICRSEKYMLVHHALKENKEDKKEKRKRKKKTEKEVKKHGEVK